MIVRKKISRRVSINIWKKLELPTTGNWKLCVWIKLFKGFAKWNKWLPYIIHFLMSISHQAKQNYYGQKKFQSAEGFKPLLVFTLEKITRNIFRYSLIHKYVYQSALHIFLTITLFLVLLWKQFYLYCTKLNRYIYYLPMYLVTIDLTPTTACR